MADIIIVFVSPRGERSQRRELVRGDYLGKHSLVLRRTLNDTPPNGDGSPKVIEVHGGGGPMSTIINAIESKGHQEDLKLHTVQVPGIEAKAMLWEACEILQIVPTQWNLRGHLRSHITHVTITPGQLITFHRVFERSRDSKREGEKLSTWEALAHQTAWFIENDGGYNAAEAQALKETADQHAPELSREITKRLRSLVRWHKIEREKKEAAERRRISREVAAHNALMREQRDEELRGERVLSEHTARQVLNRPDAGVWYEVKGKHGQRKPAGQGRRNRGGADGAAEGADGEA